MYGVAKQNLPPLTCLLLNNQVCKFDEEMTMRERGGENEENAVCSDGGCGSTGISVVGTSKRPHPSTNRDSLSPPGDDRDSHDGQDYDVE